MKVFSALIWSLLWTVIDSQDFCDSYSQNLAVIPFHDRTTHEAVLIVEGRYWSISSHNKTLSLESNPSIGFNDFLKEYSFPINWGQGSGDTKYGLFDPKTKKIVEMSYSKGVFKEVNNHTVEDPLKLSVNLTAVITNGLFFISQHFDENSKLVSTVFEIKWKSNTIDDTLIVDGKDVSVTFNSYFKQYYSFGYVSVGYVFSHMIVRHNGNFKYCLWNDCKDGKPLKPLIYCDPNKPKPTPISTPNETHTEKLNTTQKTKEESNAIYYVIAIITAIILLIVCYFSCRLCFRKDVDPSNQSKTVSTKIDGKSSKDSSIESLGKSNVIFKNSSVSQSTKSQSTKTNKNSNKTKKKIKRIIENNFE